MPKTLIVIYLATALASVLISVFVLFQNKTSNNNRSFFGFTFFQVLWILSLLFGYFYAFKQPPELIKSGFFVKMAYSMGLLVIFFLNIFLYNFPRKSFEFGKKKIYAYVILSLLIAILAGTDLVHDEQIFENGAYIADSFGPFYNLYTIYMLLLLLLAAFIATKKMITLRGLEQRKIMYTATGCWLFILTSVITNIILPLFGIYTIGKISLIQISPVYTLFFSVPTFYSIYKHRFFNFSYVSFHALRAVLFYAIFLLSIFIFSTLLLYFVPGLNIFVLVVISALVAYAVNEKIQNYVPEFVSEELREFRKTIRELQVEVLSSEKLTQLQNIVEKAFIVQHNFVTAKLYAVRNKGANFELPVYQKNVFTKNLEELGKDVLVQAEIEFEKMDGTLKQGLLAAMQKLEADICLPLFSEGKLIGFLALKRKDSNAVYAREEIDEIITIKGVLEITLMNILLKLNLEEENNLMKSIVDEKTKQLKKKVEEVNELLKQQADFIAVTAHEFRTPLSIAIFQLDDVLNSKKSAKGLLEDLKLVETSINNLKLLTEKFFAVQQYDLNKVELELKKTNITTFVGHLYKDFAPIMKDKGIRFSLKADAKKKLFSAVDQSQFRQVLHNVLMNASKFTPKGGQVLFSLSSRDGEIEIRVDDSGEGIPGNLKRAVFDKFRTTSIGAGIGLGLYLCKKIVELHQGKIWAEDSSLGGASFRIRLKSAR